MEKIELGRLFFSFIPIILLFIPLMANEDYYKKELRGKRNIILSGTMIFVFFFDGHKIFSSANTLPVSLMVFIGKNLIPLIFFNLYIASSRYEKVYQLIKKSIIKKLLLGLAVFQLVLTFGSFYILLYLNML